MQHRIIYTQNNYLTEDKYLVGAELYGDLSAEMLAPMLHSDMAQ